MTYSDYFENKVEALINDRISVVVCTLSKQDVYEIQESFTVSLHEVESTLAKYDYYKAELGGNSVTIYVHDQEKI